MTVLKDIQRDTELQRETSDNTVLSTEVPDPAKLDTLIKLINGVDGGGVVLVREA